MKSLKGTKTEQNLMSAFAGESQAYNKYGYYSKKAKEDGYVQIGKIFKETSKNEKEHAELWFKLLHDGKIPDTLTNLGDAAGGEHYEHAEMYPAFAKVAREEGFDEIAAQFEGVSAIEKLHEDRYKTLASNIQNKKVFSKDSSVEWKCLNCGHVHVGTSAPQKCPVCQHEQKYFEVLARNY